MDHQSERSNARLNAFQFLAGGYAPYLKGLPRVQRWVTLQGAVLLAVAALAAVSVTYALSIAKPDTPVAILIGFGLLWAFLIFSLDLMILLATKTGWLRMALAIAFGLVVSEIIVLGIFQRDIDAQLAIEAREADAALRDEIDTQIAQETALVADPTLAGLTDSAERIRSDIVAERERIDQLQDEFDEKATAVELEDAGLAASGVEGCGPICQQKIDARDEVAALLAQSVAREQTLVDELASVEGGLRDAADGQIPPMTSAERTARFQELYEQRSAAIESNNGLLAREEALFRLMREHPSMLGWRIGLAVLLLLVDSAVILIKAAAPTGAYTRQLEASEKSREIEAELEIATAEKNYELELLRMDARLERERQGLKHQREQEKIDHGQVWGQADRPTTDPSSRTKEPEQRPKVNRLPLEGDLVTADGFGDEWVIHSVIVDGMSDDGRRLERPRVMKAVRSDGGDGEPAVIKYVRTEDEPYARRLLTKEVEIYEQLSADRSPYLAEMIYADTSNEGRSNFMALRWYEGRDLETRHAQQPLSIEEVLDVAEQCLLGLEHAAALHLDIKPSNVFIDQWRSDDFALPVRIGDWGTFKHLDHDFSGADTRAAFTPWYASPEVMLRVAGRDNVPDPSRASDLYGVAATCYSLLARKRPFKSKFDGLVTVQARDVMEQALYGEIFTESLRELRPDVPASVAALIDRWLNGVPTKRAHSSPADDGYHLAAYNELREARMLDGV